MVMVTIAIVVSRGIMALVLIARILGRQLTRVGENLAVDSNLAGQHVSGDVVRHLPSSFGIGIGENDSYLLVV